jgi:hypothetical protein
MEFPTEEPKAPTSYPMSTLPKWVQFDRKVRIDCPRSSSSRSFVLA